MVSARDVYRQMQALTSDLIALGLCDHQNFPSMRDNGHGTLEIDFGKQSRITIALKDIPYREAYDEMTRTQAYNARMLDGALIQMMYRFNHEGIIEHRLAFLPSPYLEEFQNNPDIYLQEEVFAEVIRMSIVPFPLRFDFNARHNAVPQTLHPRSHLTLGQYQHCRIPVSAPLTPFHFVSFILCSFYHTTYARYSDQIGRHAERFYATIAEADRELLFVQVPMAASHF